MTETRAADPTFSPTRAAGLARLQAFVPKAGVAYRQRRNHDLGPGQHAHVSMLSPYIRHRVVSETEVLQAVLARHSPRAAEKFVQEVFWRTYWKGWLEMRPGVWAAYRQGLATALDDLATQGGLRAGWEAACKGETGIACFDAWARELVATGYLHNHARMWFASIWIFTLRLSWELGADFFLRHLVDGDPASNTLGWRWVAGVQTRGKTYLARAANIHRYTDGRFNPEGELVAKASPVAAPSSPKPQPLPPRATPDPNLRTGFVLHTDDLSPGAALAAGPAPVASATLRAEAGLSPLELGPNLPAFLDGAMADTHRRCGLDGSETARSAEDLIAWARQNDLAQIVTAHAPVGPIAEVLERVAAGTGLPIVRIRRDYDDAAWPHATHGFFRFKDRIPDLLDRLVPRDAA